LKLQNLKKSNSRAGYPKKGRGVLCKPHRIKYAFIKEYSREYSVVVLCKVMKVHRSGYYQWLHQPISDREQENQKLLATITELYKESGGVYGHRNIHKDLKELGIHVNRKRVARLMSEAKLYGIGTYKRRPKSKVNDSWVSDITYIRTREGWLYLATVIDLYSRKVIGWATGSRQTTSLVINALKMATARLRNDDRVSSYDYTKISFLV